MKEFISISSVADSVMSLSKLLELPIENVWKQYTHSIVKECFSFEEVKMYIEKNN